jgi:hypothetical protein
MLAGANDRMCAARFDLVPGQGVPGRGGNVDRAASTRQT